MGEILVWTRVDREGAWIDKETNSAATEEKKEEIDIPDLLEPNFRAFTYAFVLDRHRLIFESRNEFGYRLGHSRVERLFRALLSADIIGEAIPEINITVIPEDDTVQKILAIPKLRRLHIHLQKPNPDEVGDDAARLLAQLESQGAKSQDVILVKAPKIDSLSPNADTRALARVASENGYVKGRGIDAEGNPVDESTKEYPKSVPVDVAADQSARVRFLHAINRLF